MSWKNDNGLNKNTTSSGWSITVRLAVLYTVSTVIILASTTGFLYWVLKNNAEHADRQFLTDRVRVLKSILKQPKPKFERLKEEVQSEVADYHFNQYYARVLNTDGSVIIETPGMSKILPVRVFSTDNGISGQKTNNPQTTKKEDHYLLISTRVPEFASDNASRTIQVALNISSQQHLLSDYLHTVVIVLVLAIILAGAVGVWAARKGMQPLEEITRTIKRISASKLEERTHPARWPAELTSLAGEFDDMLNRLEESFLRLRQFSADMAHELRTPVNNLMGGTGVVLSKARSAEEYRDVLESNLEEYNRLSQLIKNLLFLAEADHADINISTEMLDGREEIETIAEFYQVLASEKHIQINLEGDTGVSADPSLFRRAVSNILSNAIQYAPEESEIGIILSQNNGKAVVEVTDNGPGIPREHIPKLFDRFYRVDTSRSSDLGGTGLGLPIVKSIMDLHNGQIEIESEMGKGTTVLLAFPSS